MNKVTFLVAVIALFLSACSKKQQEAASTHDEKNAVYYWKTVLDIDSADMAFIRGNDIGRVYLRMFDVVEDSYASKIENMTVPNATLTVPYEQYDRLRDEQRDLEFVPVVYVTVDALRSMKNHEGVLARNIVKRVGNMCSYNELPNVSELQIDCDWTASTEESFFTLCDSIKGAVSEAGLPWKLSSTIRLHQLARKAPPVDRGVLMVYNTGGFDNPDARNSIIDPADVEPYVKNLSSYPLHLDVAYPTYSWQLLFRRRKFVGLLNGVDTSDSTRFSRLTDNSFVVKKDFPYNNSFILAGDILRTEDSPAAYILTIKKMIDSRLSAEGHSTILYHLDSDNLSKYTPDEIKDIFGN